jgi:hypothetical protein
VKKKKKTVYVTKPHLVISGEFIYKTASPTQALQLMQVFGDFPLHCGDCPSPEDLELSWGMVCHLCEESSGGIALGFSSALSPPLSFLKTAKR